MKALIRRAGFAIIGFTPLLLLGAAALAQAPARVTGDVRVDRLLSQMTLEEKLTLIHDGRENPRTYQGQAGYIGGIPRLGLPVCAWPMARRAF